MSLLQDALRKAQRSGGASSPSPLPPLRGESSGKPGTRWKAVAGILAVAFAVGVAGVLFLTRRAGSPPAVPPPPPASQAIPPQASPSPLPPSSDVAASPGASPASSPPAVRDPSSVQPAAEGGSPRLRREGRPQAPHASAPSARKTIRRTEERSAPTTPSETPTPPVPVSGAGKNPVLEKFNAGVAALNAGNAEEAARLLREVTASSPGLVEGWNALGLALLRRQRLEEADGAFSRVLSLSPRYPPGLLNTGLLRLRQERIEEGAAFFSRAAELSPGSAAPRVNLAVAQARLGRFGQSEETLLAAARRFPGHPDVLYHLGTVYDRVGDRVKGVEAYAAFLAASAGSRPLLEERVRARLRAWGGSP